MKKTFLTAYILFIPLLSIAQISYESRIEFELKDGYSGERIIQCGENGFLIHSRKDKNPGSDIVRKYELFDTNLQAIKTQEILIHKKFSVSATHHTDDYIHTLYTSNKGKYILVTLAMPSLEVTTVEGKFPSVGLATKMKVVGDYAFLKMSINDTFFPLYALPQKSDYLFVINWKENEKIADIDVLDDFNARRTAIISMQSGDNELMIHAEGRRWTKKEDYMVYFDDAGKKLEELKLHTDYDIVNISTNKLTDNQRVLTGTYGKGAYSEGIFFNTLNNNINSSNIYKFTDLDNFFSYLNTARQGVMKRKKEQKERKGKEFKKSYLMVAHDIMPLDDGYLLITEACYPTYRTIPNLTYNRETQPAVGVQINLSRSANTDYPNRRSQTAYSTIFDGYQYTHATILKFDKEGNKVWDKTFRMRVTHRPYLPVKFIHTSEKNNNSIKLIFNTGQFIVSKHIRYDGKILQDHTYEEIKTIYEADKEMWTSATINHWYDNYFIAYGWQKLKNKEAQEVKGKRKVLFVNKIKYE